MVSSVADRVPTLMSTGGQHCCCFAAASLPTVFFPLQRNRSCHELYLLKMGGVDLMLNIAKIFLDSYDAAMIPFEPIKERNLSCLQDGCCRECFKPLILQ